MKGVDSAFPKGWMAMVTTMKRVCRVPVSQVNVITSQKGCLVRTGWWQCATASTLIGDDAAEDLEDHIKGSVHKFSGGIQTRAVESESREVGKILKVGKSRENRI